MVIFLSVILIQVRVSLSLSDFINIPSLFSILFLKTNGRENEIFDDEFFIRPDQLRNGHHQYRKQFFHFIDLFHCGHSCQLNRPH